MLSTYIIIKIINTNRYFAPIVKHPHYKNDKLYFYYILYIHTFKISREHLITGKGGKFWNVNK